LWLVCGVFSLVLMLFVLFGFESNILQNTILALNGLMFILSVPLSLFFVPVAAAANHYLEINALSTDGIYHNTVFLFVLGFMQWFWIARFWYPTESVYQKLDLLDGENI
jgi:hypothetical protein